RHRPAGRVPPGARHHARPGVHRPLHARAAAGLAPVALQLRLQPPVPFPAGMVVARAGAGTVGRAVGGPVVVVAAVIVGGGVLAGVVAVGIFVGTVGAVGTVEGITHRVAGLVPAQARGILCRIPAQAGLAVQGVVPGAAAVLLAHGQAVAVGRRVVAVVVQALISVGTVGVFGAPVFGLAGGVQALGHALAGGGTGDCADRAAHQGADRAQQRAHRGACHGTAGAANADTDGMRAGRAGDRIAVEVAGFVAHRGTPRERPFGRGNATLASGLFTSRVPR